MNFEDIVSEELSLDLDAMKSEVKKILGQIADKDEEIADRDKTIKDLQARLAGANVPKKPAFKSGVGTTRTIGGANNSANTPQEKGI